MFDDLQAAWITENYKSYKAILIPSMNKQLSVSGLILDLDSLPIRPIPFKELFIRWLIAINKDRLARGLPVFINQTVVRTCPLWNLIKCPLKKIKLTKEGMFNKPTKTVQTIGSRPPTRAINRSLPSQSGINKPGGTHK